MFFNFQNNFLQNSKHLIFFMHNGCINYLYIPTDFPKKERMQGSMPASAVLTVVLIYLRYFSYILYLFFIFKISVPASKKQPSP